MPHFYRSTSRFLRLEHDSKEDENVKSTRQNLHLLRLTSLAQSINHGVNFIDAETHVSLMSLHEANNADEGKQATNEI
jgi:hypothetical protein